MKKYSVTDFTSSIENTWLSDMDDIDKGVAGIFPGQVMSESPLPPTWGPVYQRRYHGNGLPEMKQTKSDYLLKLLIKIIFRSFRLSD